MASQDVPNEYMDVLFQEFAYDPIRLSPAEDPLQMIYNRRTLETIWVTKHEAVNPYTRQPFHINNAIPQTELRQEMCQYISKNRIRGLGVIPDYTIVLKDTEMRYMLKDLVSRYRCFSEMKEKKEEDWRVLWQKLNLIRLYCQYREENKNSFLLIKGYKYLFKIIDRPLLISLCEIWYSSCDYAEEVCRELARIVDIIGLRHSELETIPGNSLKSFVYVLSNLAISDYLKIQSMVLNIYCKIFYYDIGYALEKIQCFPPFVFLIALKLLWREESRNITNKDLDNGTAILQAAWTCKREDLLSLEYYVVVVIDVVILCISRFREDVAVASPSSSNERASFTIGKALTRALKLIQYIVTAEDFKRNDTYGYEKDTLKRLDIVKDLVQMVELVVAGFEFTTCQVEIGLNIMTALCKSGLRVMRRNELRVLADFLGSEIVNKYGRNVKSLLQELINIYVKD